MIALIVIGIINSIIIHIIVVMSIVIIAAGGAGAVARPPGQGFKLTY